VAIEFARDVGVGNVVDDRAVEDARVGTLRGFDACGIVLYDHVVHDHHIAIEFDGGDPESGDLAVADRADAERVGDAGVR
jgi:hypothetical protein